MQIYLHTYLMQIYYMQIYRNKNNTPSCPQIKFRMVDNMTYRIGPNKMQNKSGLPLSDKVLGYMNGLSAVSLHLHHKNACQDLSDKIYVQISFELIWIGKLAAICPLLV